MRGWVYCWGDESALCDDDRAVGITMVMASAALAEKDAGSASGQNKSRLPVEARRDGQWLRRASIP